MPVRPWKTRWRSPRNCAPWAYTCHLKDWNLIRSRDGLIVRSCALGDGVVDLKAVVKILRSECCAGCPCT